VIPFKKGNDEMKKTTSGTSQQASKGWGQRYMAALAGATQVLHECCARSAHSIAEKYSLPYEAVYEDIKRMFLDRISPVA